MVRLRPRWVQLLLCDVPRDLSRVSAKPPPLGAVLAEGLQAEAERLAGLRGWSPRTLSLAQRGLRILMAVHGPGEPVRASTVRQLSARNMPFPHIIDVLAAAGASAISGYLAFRNQRWPATTSPYLLVTRKTAHTGQPVSEFWMTRLFCGLPVTAGQLRDDRIAEEALSVRADPLHLPAVFGFGPRTGLRYAQVARHTGEPSDPPSNSRP